MDRPTLVHAGDAVSVPLPSGGFAVGICTLVDKGLRFGIFFGPRLIARPELSCLETCKGGEIRLMDWFGQDGVADGSWQILGRLDDFDPAEWGAPVNPPHGSVSGSGAVEAVLDLALEPIILEPDPDGTTPTSGNPMVLVRVNQEKFCLMLDTDLVPWREQLSKVDRDSDPDFWSEYLQVVCPRTMASLQSRINGSTLEVTGADLPIHRAQVFLRRAISSERRMLQAGAVVKFPPRSPKY